MSSVKVPLLELKNAASVSKMRRSLKGHKGYIAQKTTIDFHPNFLVIDGPCGFR